MSPLVYLQIRRIVNGVRRSFKTPVRAMMTILIAAYFLFIFGTMVIAPPAHKFPAGAPVPIDDRLPLAVGTLLQLVLLALVIPPPRYFFSFLTDTDIALLTPVPLRPWRVFGFFLYSRTMLSLVVFVGILTFYEFFFMRGLWPGAFAGLTGPAAGAGIALYCVTVVSLCCALFLGRVLVDLLRVVRRIPAWLFPTIVSLYCAGWILPGISTVLNSMRFEGTFVNGLANAMDVPLVSFLLFPFRLPSLLLFHWSTLPFWQSAGAALVWPAAAAAAHWMLKARESELYIYAVAAAEHRTRIADRMRNPAAQYLHKGKTKKAFGQLPWFLRGWNPRGVLVLLWRDLLISWRSHGLTLLFLQGMLVLLVIAARYLTMSYGVRLKPIQVELFTIMGLMIGVFPLAMMSQMTFMEILKRAEIQKPLPFRALPTVAVHCLQGMFVACSVSMLPAFAGLALFSGFEERILLTMLGGWSFCYVLISSLFYVALFNPDQHDPIQRLYGPLFGMGLSMLSITPACGALFIGFFLHAPVPLLIFLVLALNGLAVFVLHVLSARKYEVFVYTE